MLMVVLWCGGSRYDTDGGGFMGLETFWLQWKHDQWSLQFTNLLICINANEQF